MYNHEMVPHSWRAESLERIKEKEEEKAFWFSAFSMLEIRSFQNQIAKGVSGFTNLFYLLFVEETRNIVQNDNLWLLRMFLKKRKISFGLNKKGLN